MSQTCKHCGADLSHLRAGSMYCRRIDGDGSCYKSRKVKELMERAARMKKLCVVCKKKYVKDPARDTCGYACAAKLRTGKACKHHRTSKVDGNLDGWPYKLPMDLDVTPSMMNPMG